MAWLHISDAILYLDRADNGEAKYPWLACGDCEAEMADSSDRRHSLHPAFGLRPHRSERGRIMNTVSVHAINSEETRARLRQRGYHWE